MVIAAVDQNDIDISVPQRPCRGDAGKAAADNNDAFSLSVRSFDNCGCLVRPVLSQHRTHNSPRLRFLSLTALASSRRKRCSQRSLRHTGARDATILQCAGLLGEATALSSSGFTVIMSITKQIPAMTNVTMLKTCFILAPRISAWRCGDASQFPASVVDLN